MRMWWLSLVVIMADVSFAAAQAEAPASPPVVKPEEPDPMSRDQDRMRTDASAGGREGFGDPSAVGGNPDAVIKGNEARLPEGTAVPIRGGMHLPAGMAPAMEAHGFVHTELLLTVPDGPGYRLTFLPREVELDVLARPADLVLVRLDINYQTQPEPLVFSSLLEQDAFELLVEQAFAQWEHGVATLRAGKFNVPFGTEALDAVDRVPLTRSSVAELAKPDLLTGLTLDIGKGGGLSGYVLGANGWDLSVDTNRSKTFGGGVRYRLGEAPEGAWFYEGNLSALLGVEKVGINHVRGLIDYSGKLRPLAWLALSLELVYGWEEGEGYTKQVPRTKAKDLGRELAGVWYGGHLGLTYEGGLGPASLQPLVAELRLEYLRDPDLTDVVLQLPHDEPGMTTLVGAALAVRYRLARGFEVAAEYRADFERGDVENVSVKRNYSNLLQWFITQEVLVGVVGSF